MDLLNYITKKREKSEDEDSEEEIEKINPQKKGRKKQAFWIL